MKLSELGFLKDISGREAEIISGGGVDVIAGPIFSNRQAQTRCPQVCGSLKAKWNGNWNTIIPGRQSVCNCNPGKCIPA